MSLGNFFQQLFGPSETSNKTSTGTTAGTNYSQSNIFQDPRFQGFLGSYYDQAGQSGPMNQWQLGGLQGLAGATGYMQPGFAASADIAQNGIPGADVNRFYNQNTQNYVDAMQRQFNTQNAIQNAQNQAVAARQGALTGSGAATQRAQTQMAQHTAQDPIVAKAYWDAQQNAQQMAAQNTGQRLQAAGQAPSFVGAATGAGAQQFGAGNTWWNDPWQRQVALMGGFQPAIGASGQTGNYTGQQAGTQTGVNQQLPSLGGLAAQGIGFIGSMFADGGAIPGYEDGGAVEGFGYGGMPGLPNWMGRPGQSGGQPGATPFATNLSAPLGAPMGMPATGNAMPQAPAPNITGAPKPQLPLAPVAPAPVAQPPRGAPPPVAPAPPAPSAPSQAPLGQMPLGGLIRPPGDVRSTQGGAGIAVGEPYGTGSMTPTPLGQPQPGAFNVPQGATTQTAAVQPQPSLAKNWMNMAQGGAVGAAGDGHISGFADKVMHATRMFKEMKKELGGRVEGYGTGGVPDPEGVGRFAKPDLLYGGRGEDDVWNTTTTPEVGGDAWNTTTTPEAGGSVGSAWGPHYGPTASGGPSNEDDPRFWDNMRSKAIANDPGMSRRPAAPSMWDKIGQFGRENTWGPQARQPQGQGAQKDDFAEFMSNLSKTARAGLGQGQQAMGTRAEGGRIGYDDGGPTFWDTLSDWGGRVGSALTPNLETGMYSGKTTAEGRPSGFQNLMTTLGSVDASKPGFNWAPGAERVLDRRFKEMEAEREGNRLYADMTGKVMAPGAGPGGRPTDQLTLKAQTEQGKVFDVPTVQSRQVATQELTAPYQALELRNRAAKEDPALVAKQIRIMQKLDNKQPLTQEDLDDLSMLNIPYPAFPGQPGAPGAKTSAAGSPGVPPRMSGAAPAGPVTAAPPSTPAPIPVAGRPGSLPPAIPQDTPSRTPQALAADINEAVLAKSNDPAFAEGQWKALMSDPNNLKMVQDYYRRQGVPMPDWLTAARGFVGGVGSQAAPGQMPAPRQVPGTLVPQGGDTRTSVRQGREFAPAEAAIRKPYGGPDENTLKYQVMLNPSIKDILAHDPARQAAIKRAGLEEERDMKITAAQEVGKPMVRAMDQLRDSMVEAGPDVLWWASGPFLSNPGVRKWVSALATQDSNVAQGHELGVQISHDIDAILLQLPQLGVDPAKTDAARENAKSALAEAFKARDMEKVFKVFHNATNMVLRAAYLREEPPQKSYYPKEWIERGLLPRGAGYAPKNAPPGLVQQMEQERAAAERQAPEGGIPAGAMKDLFAMGVNKADGSFNQPIIDSFNKNFNHGEAGLAERLLFPDRP